MVFNDLLMIFGLQTRVLHRLPGRIRIAVPALRKVPVEQREIAAALFAALPLPAGIQSIRPTFVTGNVLLEYDFAIITEEQVLAYIRTLVALFVKHRDKLIGMAPAKLPKVMAQLTHFLENGGRSSGKSLGEVAIPDHVWN